VTLDKGEETQVCFRTTVLILLLVLFSSCERMKQPQIEIPELADETVADDAHSSRISLDWWGKYFGVLPCADCEGIETVVVLNQDNTFVLRTIYLGRGDGTPFETTGEFVWNDAGSTVTLQGLHNRPGQYIVGEGTLTQLDMAGQRITGRLADMYVLKITR
jgi:uncharacterized lipoprotein NlpE involved in copper resistance